MLVTPVESLAKAGTSTANTSHPAPATTSAWAYRRLVVFTGVKATTTITPPAGGTERADLNSTGTNAVTSQAYDRPINAGGSTGTAAAVSAVAGADTRIAVLLTPKTEYQRYSYAASGDTADLTLDANNNVLEATLTLPGGVLYTDRNATKVWSYPNLHGDIAATADHTGTKQGATHTYDPYGNTLAAIADNSNGNLDYAWLGQHQRPLEHQTGLTPTIGSEQGSRHRQGFVARQPRVVRGLRALPVAQHKGLCSIACVEEG